MSAESRRDRLLAGIVLAAIFAVALVVSSGSFDMYRLPKTLLVRAEAILIAAVVLGAMVHGARVTPDWRSPALSVPLGLFAAMSIVTITSSKPALSADALATAAATLVIFLATVHAARTREWRFVAVPLAAAVLNAILICLQATNVWMPFGVRTEIPRAMQNAALAGNPNEAGGYLAVAALAALAALSVRRDAWRAIAFAVLLAGVIASRSLTAISSLAIAVVVMGAMRSLRAAIAAAATAAAIVLILVAVPGPFRERAGNLARWARSGDYNAMLTERATPFIAASLMFRDHPVTGVGPAAFAWHYYDYKLQAEERYPVLRNAYNRGVNYGEVHNDHLQLLAEGGVIGYAAFLLAIAMLAMQSLQTPDPFVRRLALPLAAFWLVLSLAQFPLETPIVRTLLMHFAALCIGWGRQ